MVSFIKLDSPLELESPELARLRNFLAEANAPAQFAVPVELQNYVPRGCRVLRFRGRDVSLVCFKIGGGKVAHLFVIDARAMHVPGSPQSPVFAAEGSWMTASWSDGGLAYLLAVPGDRAKAEQFFGNS